MIKNQVFLNSIKAEKGTYIVIYQCSIEQCIDIGKLGTLETKKGYYLYVGSAFGKGGIKARVKRHCNESSRPHWHIDYLKKVLTPWEIWLTYDPIKREHQWANLLEKSMRLSMPLHGFGSSDCSCYSHLFYSYDCPDFSQFSQVIDPIVPESLNLEKISHRILRNN